jgi:hypothetical protein
MHENVIMKLTTLSINKKDNTKKILTANVFWERNIFISLKNNRKVTKKENSEDKKELLKVKNIIPTTNFVEGFEKKKVKEVC